MVARAVFAPQRAVEYHVLAGERALGHSNEQEGVEQESSVSLSGEVF